MPDKNYAGNSGLSAIFGAIKSALNNKVDKEAGKGLSTNDYTNEEKAALAGKQDELTFDDVPTDGSNNPVKSGGVYASDEAIRQWTTAEAKSVSGNPITLTDGSARNVEGLEVTCEPVQNLHGYDHPWAGGAGKNKLETVNITRTASGITYTVQNDGSFIANRTEASSNLSVFAITNNNNSLDNNQTTPFKSGDIIIATSGVNGLPLKCRYANGTYVTLTENTAVTLADDVAVIYVEFANTQNPSNIHFYPMIRVSGDNTWMPYSNICPIEGYTECVVDVKDEEETTQGTATIAFGQTVYGGSVDFKTGKVTVTHGFADMDELTWSWDGGLSGFVSDSIASAVKKPSTNYQVLDGLCEVYPVVAREGASNNQLFVNTNGRIGVVTNMYEADPTTFKTAMSGLHLCYELATPTELTLTPAELELLKGYNYITTNGTTIALAYLPDSLLAEVENYVDAKIPPVPSDDGTYVLTCTVTSGTPAYTWESAT